MADEPKQPTPYEQEPAEAPTPVGPDPENPNLSAIRDDGMDEHQIRQAGLLIDVPFESGVAKPEKLVYSDTAGEPWVDDGDYLNNLPTVPVTPPSDLPDHPVLATPQPVEPLPPHPDEVAAQADSDDLSPPGEEQPRPRP